MKTTFALLLICIKFLNAIITDTRITDVKPIPVQKVETILTLTIKKGEITGKNKVYFHKDQVAAVASDPNCEIEPKAEDTTVECKVTLPLVQLYKMTIGLEAEYIQAFSGLDVKANMISGFSITTVNKVTTITINTKGIFADEIFQFHTGNYVTSATEPAPASCKKAEDNKSTACAMKETTNGFYKLFIDQKYVGYNFKVSSGYISLAFGLLLSFFLF